MKHFISILDYSQEELVELLDRADYLAAAWRENRMPKSLINQKIGLWFYGNGFRNRVAFEMGARAMGADVTYIPGELGKEEPLEDVIHYLQNWYSMLVIRAKSHQDLTFLANSSNIPIINARTNVSHPCEIIGDLQFIRKHRSSLEDLNVVFVGEVTNLCMSWFEAAVKFPIKVTQVSPLKYQANDNLIRTLNAKASGYITTNCELDSVIEKADLIYTDCWPKASDDVMKANILTQFLPYQITSKHLSKLHRKAMFLPCPPVNRGQEVSEEAMKSELCMNYKAKDYLLHSQNAIMEMVYRNSTQK
ncbi:MAG: ornithine carbamoyltransferase [Mobilitalea sp.]